MNEDRKLPELNAVDFERPFVVEQEKPLFLYIVLGLIAVWICVFLYFFPQLANMWANLKPGSQITTAQIIELSTKLGLSNVPPSILTASNFDQTLDRLRREPCDRAAMLTLATQLADSGYLRGGANALTGFASRCRNGDDALYRAAQMLMGISDYDAVIRITTALIDSTPASSEARYMRGQAFQSMGRHEQALSDFVTTIELVGDIKRVSSVVFTDLSGSYAVLKRYCEAISPIQMWIAADPSDRDTTQARAVIADYAKKGACDSNYAKGSDRFFTLGDDVIKAKVEINGTSGVFIIDTGASLVSLTPSFAKRSKIRMDEDNHIRLQTANGSVDGLLGVAHEIRIGRLQASDVAVVVGSSDTSSFGKDIDGLLGMSFLARYEVTLSGRELRLTEKRKF